MQGIHLRKYGVATTINFELYDTDGINLKTDAAHASGDTNIMKDEGAEANTTNAFVDRGQGYSIALTATEMQAARIVIYIVDQGTKVWLDKVICIETYGNASALHAFDLGTASAAQTGDNYARLGAPAGASVSADVAAVKSDTAITDIATVDGKVDTAIADVASVKGVVDAIVIDTAEIGVAGAGLTDLGGMSTAMKAQVNAEVVDVITVDAVSELAAIPAANASLADKLNLVSMAVRNGMVHNRATGALQVNKDDTTALGTCTVTDTGGATGTLTRPKFA